MAHCVSLHAIKSINQGCRTYRTVQIFLRVVNFMDSAVSLQSAKIISTKIMDTYSHVAKSYLQSAKFIICEIKNLTNLRNS